MGLDMFLYPEKYESKARKSEEEWKKEKDTFFPPELKKIMEGMDKYSISKTTVYEVAYWRKENAIHKWIVDNCADGVDECQRIYMRKENIEMLISLCSQVLLDHTRAEELLPTTDGFFFGGTEYDEYYFWGLENTVKMLDPVLELMKENPDYDVFYQASW